MNLLESISDWTISLENRFANHVAYIDFSRAFDDTICHPKLLHKLKSYGIEGVWSMDREFSDRALALYESE